MAEDYNCFFCDGYRDHAVLHETESFYIYLEEFPVSPGHCLVVVKDHKPAVSDLEEGDWNKIQELIQKAQELAQSKGFEKLYRKIPEKNGYEKSEKMVEDVLSSGNLEEDPDGFNIGINQGEAAGQTVNHLHIHVIPRYEGDVENPGGGVRGVIPEKKDYRTD